MHPMHWLLTAVYKNAEEDISNTAIWRERAARHCGRQTPVVAERGLSSGSNPPGDMLHIKTRLHSGKLVKVGSSNTTPFLVRQMAE